MGSLIASHSPPIRSTIEAYAGGSPATSVRKKAKKNMMAVPAVVGPQSPSPKMIFVRRGRCVAVGGVAVMGCSCYVLRVAYCVWFPECV